MDTRIDEAAALAERLDAMRDGRYLKVGRYPFVWETFESGLCDLFDRCQSLLHDGLLTAELRDSAYELRAWHADMFAKEVAQIERAVTQFESRRNPVLAAHLREQAEARQAAEDAQDARIEAMNAKVDANQAIAAKLEADPEFHRAMQRQRAGASRTFALSTINRARARRIAQAVRPNRARSQRPSRRRHAASRHAARAPSRRSADDDPDGPDRPCPLRALADLAKRAYRHLRRGVVPAATSRRSARRPGQDEAQP